MDCIAFHVTLDLRLNMFCFCNGLHQAFLKVSATLVGCGRSVTTPPRDRSRYCGADYFGSSGAQKGKMVSLLHGVRWSSEPA